MGFFRATRHNKIEIVKYLLKQNVDADAKNINNQTALHNACFKGAHEIVKLLLDHGLRLIVIQTVRWSRYTQC